jgi:hypothetical protein
MLVEWSLTEVSWPSRLAPPKVNNVPDAIASVLVNTNAGVATASAYTSDTEVMRRRTNG